MKYPASQFEKLKKILSELSVHFENLKEIHPAQLHYITFQQVSPGQTHNRLVNCNGAIIRQYAANGNKFTPLFETDSTFELYPSGCNDEHIVTAVKKVLSAI